MEDKPVTYTIEVYYKYATNNTSQKEVYYNATDICIDNETSDPKWLKICYKTDTGWNAVTWVAVDVVHHITAVEE